MDKLGAVILAAGRSSRMGSFKPMLPLGSSTIIETVINKLIGAGTCELVVVVGREADRLRSHLDRYEKIRYIENRDFASTDMFYSAKMGMDALSRTTEIHFFLPCDIPLFKPDTLEKMIYCYEETGAGIVTPVHGGKSGHPILIKRSMVADLLAYNGNDGLRGAIRNSGVKVETVEVDDIGVLLDADTPQDYEMIHKLAKG
ncbi:MAG: nucleotidyltransferase family protein [Eubacteriaceae bacterium]|nr:nucleotidyltransferase family protein [Eubacteriaceae bacterium]